MLNNQWLVKANTSQAYYYDFTYKRMINRPLETCITCTVSAYNNLLLEKCNIILHTKSLYIKSRFS